MSPSRSSAPRQKTLPTTEASRGRARSRGGSASRRAATMPRTFVGSCAAPAQRRSASDAASSSMKSGFPSARSAIAGTLRRVGRAPSRRPASSCERVGAQRVERQRGVRGQAAAPSRPLGEQLGPGERDEQEHGTSRSRGASVSSRSSRLARPSGCPRTRAASAPGGECLDEHPRREEERLAVGDGAPRVEPDEGREIRGVLLGASAGPSSASTAAAQLRVRARAAGRCRRCRRSA